MSVTGEADGKPGGGPQKVGVPIVDIMTGMYAAIAVLAALARRQRDRPGRACRHRDARRRRAFLANQAMNYLISGARRGAAATPIRTSSRRTCSPSRDGHFALAVGNDDQFARSDVLERPDIARV